MVLVNELNDNLAPINVSLDAISGYPFASGALKRYGKIITVNISTSTTVGTAADTWTTIGTISDSQNYPTVASILLGKLNASQVVFDAQITTAGVIRIRPHGSALVSGAILTIGGVYITT